MVGTAAERKVQYSRKREEPLSQIVLSPNGQRPSELNPPRRVLSLMPVTLGDAYLQTYSGRVRRSCSHLFAALAHISWVPGDK